MLREVVCIKNKDPFLPGRTYMDSNGSEVKDINKACTISIEKKQAILKDLSSPMKLVSFVEVEDIKVDKIY